MVDLDVSWLVPADLYAVDALGRLQVAVARRGRSLQLHAAHVGLVELLELLGMSGVISVCRCCGRARGAALPNRADQRPQPPLA
jgi:hypothetical protein